MPIIMSNVMLLCYIFRDSTNFMKPDYIRVCKFLTKQLKLICRHIVLLVPRRKLLFAS